MDRYRTKFGNPIYQYKWNKQSLTILDENHYTSGGFNMIDDFNQSVIFNNCFLVDRVNSYTLKQLEQSLIGARSWWQWRDNIKSKFDNPTD